MTTKRLLLALITFTLLLPLSGCGCRRNSCNDTRTLAPPPGQCCPAPPPGTVPSAAPF
jgi:hypothetical protein